MATENLKVKITANASQAKAEIKEFKQHLKGVKSGSIESAVALGKMSSSIGLLGAAAVGAAASVAALTAGIKNAVSVAALGDEIKDQAQKVFMSTTAYQEWGYVLKQNGVDMSALKMGMRTFAKEVAAGDEALARYGVTSSNIETAFGQAMTSIQNIGNETERVAAATELFGSRALELMPIFNLTNAETQNLMMSYRALGGTMSNELIAASDVCTDSITAMNVSWQGLKNTLAGAFLPAITKVVQWITVAIAKIRILIAAFFGLKSSFGGSSGGASGKTGLVGSTGRVAGNTGKTANNLKKAARAAKELRRSLLKIDELTKLAVKASTSSGGSSGGGGGGGVSGGGVSGGDIGTGAIDSLLTDEQLESIQKFQEKIESIKDKIEGIKEIWVGFIKLLVFHDKTGLDDIWDGLVKIFPQLETVKQKWQDFKDLVAQKFAEVKITVSEKFDSIKEKWQDLKDTIKDKLVNITAKIPTWSDLKSKWNNLMGYFKGKTAKIGLSIPSWSSFKKKWKDLLDKFKGKKAKITLSFKDQLKSGYNALAKKIQAARKKWPATKLILPDIHPLAKGGVLKNPTMALMGEYTGAKSNPEIATPQKLMYQTMVSANSEMVGAFAQMTQQVIAAIERKDLNVSIGDDKIAASAQRGNKSYYQRTGKALITV